MDEADRPKVLRLYGDFSHGEQHHLGTVEVFQGATVMHVEGAESIGDINLDYFPAHFVEIICETIWTRCLLIWQASDSSLNLVFHEGPIQFQARYLLQGTELKDWPIEGT